MTENDSLRAVNENDSLPAVNENDSLERALTVADNDYALPALEDSAAAAGLLDVAYATLDSEMGKLLLACTPRGLVRIAYVASGEEDFVLAQLALKLSPRILAAPRKLDRPRRELEQYFSGARKRFELSIDWQLTRGFGRRVLAATAAIPFGSVSTYKQVASEAGSPRAARAAGNALGANPLPIVIPCHRVLHSTGGLGGYTGGLERKRRLLAVEGRSSMEGPASMGV